MSDRVLIRPGGGEGAARMVYNRIRVDELKRERARIRADRLEAAQRTLDRLDLEIAGLSQIRARELAHDLGASGFDTSGMTPLRLPTQLERDARRHRGQGAPIDAAGRARAEEAADRGRLIRVFTPPIRVR